MLLNAFIVNSELLIDPFDASVANFQYVFVKS